MTREDAIAKMSKGIDVIRQKHPNGGAFDYIKETGGNTLINKIYDDIESQVCENCKLKDKCIVLSGLEKETQQLPYDYVSNFIMDTFSCNTWESK